MGDSKTTNQFQNKRERLRSLCHGTRSMLEKSYAGGEEISVLYTGTADKNQQETTNNTTEQQQAEQAQQGQQGQQEQQGQQGEQEHVQEREMSNQTTEEIAEMLQKEMQMNMFGTHVTRIIHRRTKMANPLLKPRDAVVLQDCFYIRKHLTDSNNNAMAENEDSEEAIKIYLEQMTRHLDTLQLTKNSHLKELNLLEKNNNSNNNNNSSEAAVTSLKTLLTMLNVEIQKYTSY